jgi:hypothetical protein
MDLILEEQHPLGKKMARELDQQVEKGPKIG